MNCSDSLWEVQGNVATVLVLCKFWGMFSVIIIIKEIQASGNSPDQFEVWLFMWCVSVYNQIHCFNLKNLHPPPPKKNQLRLFSVDTVLAVDMSERNGGNWKAVEERCNIRDRQLCSRDLNLSLPATVWISHNLRSQTKNSLTFSNNFFFSNLWSHGNLNSLSCACKICCQQTGFSLETGLRVVG